MKKRIVSLLIGAALLTGAFAGCKSNLPKTESNNAEESSTQTPSEPTTEQPVTAEGGLKLGFAVLSSVGQSKDAGEEDGLAKTDTFAAAILLDNDTIVKCVIDGPQTNINFNKEGKLVTPLDTVVPTKKELGDKYGMKVASSIGKEWNEQTIAFEEFVQGKTLAQVKGISIGEDGKPTEADLTASVTMSINNMIDVIEKAAANAQPVAIDADAKLGLGIYTHISKSKDAGEEDGLAQAYSTYAVVTVDGEGKITTCTLDGSQSNVNFDKEGKIKSDLNAALKTKNELGADYGMKAASGIGKEWNEQALAYANYVVGKTADEVKGIAVAEGGTVEDAELATSVTVGVGDFNTVIEKAINTAK